MEHIPTQIAAAINMRALYPANHPRVVQTIEQIVAGVHRLLQQTKSDSVTYLIVGDDLVFGQDVIRKTSLSVRQFIEVLKRRGIERLTLAAGLQQDEAHQLIGALASNEPVASSRHIILGRVHVELEEENLQVARRELSPEQLENIREAWAKFRVERKLPMGEMEDLVWNFIDSISRTTRAILPLAKLKEHDEYTFVHSVNVSLLVLAQARSFGIQGPMLHAFGMAALLHDIGKLSVPIAVLNKPGKLEGVEWETMKGHAQQGAWYLGEVENASPLSVVVAFEHHLRYDGQPNYPVLRSPRVPNLASRMTSIADTYDAMSTVRPYQQPLSRAASFELLKKRSETFYDPLLVANFIRLVTEAA
ncbi:MAG TPA: HD domain-containing phosphohydrolase [Thermoanaerobaculia bacterium]|nr:HD domain-containing phosphohydrolase [Thermoanaerobaculia bacterium]